MDQAELVRLFLDSNQTSVDVQQAKTRLGKDFDKYLQRYYNYKKKSYRWSRTLEGEILKVS